MLQQKCQLFPTYDAEETKARFGYEYAPDVLAKIVVRCSCGIPIIAAYAAHQQRLRRKGELLCRSCACSRRPTGVDWQARLSALPCYDSKLTKERFGYEYPSRSEDKILTRCPSCSASLEKVTMDFVRSPDARCRPCVGKEEFEMRRTSMFAARDDYWSKEENIEKASATAKTQKWRGTYFKQINSSDRSKEIWACPERRARNRDHMKKDWEANRERRLEAERRARSGRVESLRKTAQTPEYRDQVSKTQKEVWQDPLYRGLRSQIQREVCQRPEYKSKIAAAWTSEKREQMRAKMQDPEMKPRLLTNKVSSRDEALVSYFLSSYGVEHQRQYIDYVYTFDLFIPSDKTYIEYNGHRFHNKHFVVGDKGQKNLSHDKSKRTFVQRHRPEHRLITITEDHLFSKGGLMRVFSEYTKDFDYDLEQVETRQEVTDEEACLFLDLFHYKERSRTAPGLKVGAYLEGKLIGLAVYATATTKEATSEGFNYKEVLELTRFCVHPGYGKKDLALWLLAETLSILIGKFPEVRAVITHVDTMLEHDGAVYQKAGFEFRDETAPDFHYRHLETGALMHKRTLLGISSKMGTTEAEYANLQGFEKAWGAKKRRFLLRL